MFSRDDSDRCFDVIDDITFGICGAVLLIAAGVGVAILLTAIVERPFVLGALLGAGLLFAFIWQAYRRIRRRLSRPDEHETNYADRVG